MNSNCFDKVHKKFHGPAKVFWIIGMAIVGIAFAALLALVFGLVVKGLWNWLMPMIFGLPIITYWQAFGLIILSKILFGSFGNHHEKKAHTHKKMESKYHKYHGYSDDCKPDHDWKHYEEFWEKEGKEKFDEFLKAKKEEKPEV